MSQHYTKVTFWKLYDKLPYDIQRIADKQYRLLEDDPQHPSLQFKPIGPFWSARVTKNYRALARKQGNDFVWFWIGHHDDYDRIIG
ncbi:MAG: hypothetical protein AAF267_09750 [Deinococcota bacterium]